MPIYPVGPVLHGLPVAWTPTASPTSGSWSSSSIAGSRMIRVSHWCYFWVQVNIINNGTGAGVVHITLPLSFKEGMVTGREVNAVGTLLRGYINGSVLQVANYNQSYPGGNNYHLQLSGMLEV